MPTLSTTFVFKFIALTVITIDLLYFGLVNHLQNNVSLNSETNVIKYRGKVNFDNYEALINAYNSAEIKPKWIDIRSTGGSMIAGIQIGHFIHKNKLNIYVNNYCMSSCANYVFVAAKKKRLSPHALVVYHGGVLQANAEDNYETFRNYRNKKQVGIAGKESSVKRGDPRIKKYFKCSNKETCFDEMRTMVLDFYAQLGVDPYITTYGQQGHFLETYHSYRYDGFYYDIETMKSMGVSNIKVKGGSWTPEKNKHFGRFYKADITESNI